MSPLSLAVVFEQIKRGKDMTLREVFEMEYKICQGFMHHREFFEGVRALLIDKDKSPQWSHSKVSQVTKEDVDQIFNRHDKYQLDF